MLEKFKHIYFLGIGGIGMSALARYFYAKNFAVSGYDKTSTKLTNQLQKEGIAISFKDQGKRVVEHLPEKGQTLIVFTPAVPPDHEELIYFKANGYKISKRAEVLGMITRQMQGITVAGTHGKTTCSTMLSHVLYHSEKGCNAFLGGLSTNYNTNLLLNDQSQRVVIEADEFDRSFLHLNPFASILTSTEADHLDIYKDLATIEHAFQEFILRINKKGVLVKHYTIPFEGKCRSITYGLLPNQKTDFLGNNLRVENENFVMDVTTPKSFWKDVVLGLPGIHNAENALAVIAIADYLGVKESVIRTSLASFSGIKRRFECHVKTPEMVYIDDYAHHPSAIKKLVESVRLLYPNKSICGVFQPHLYSRTADFMDDFAHALSQLDELILLPIYPAREKPREGITSKALLALIKLRKKKVLSPKEALIAVKKMKKGVLLTIGAGDIDQLVEPIKSTLS